MAKLKDEQDDVVDKLEKSSVLVVELWEAVFRAKKFAVDEFKSSSEFLKTVEDAASKKFSEGFDFCKWQLRCHHLDLAINLEYMGLDHDVLAEEVDGKEEEGDNADNEEKNKGSPNPPPS